MQIFKTILPGSVAFFTVIGVAAIVSRMFRPYKSDSGIAEAHEAEISSDVKVVAAICPD